MPIYEYVCRGCAERFEALLYGREKAVCPSCGKRDLEKLRARP
jgi:putative FmdB family regulatory protein